MNFSVVTMPVSFDFTPRHGTIIPITPSELYALNVKWNPSAVAVAQPKTRFSVYPVPAKDHLTVEFDGSATVRAEIYNSVGSRVLQQDLIHSQSQLNVSGLKSGIYFIKCIQNNNLIGSIRFIVDE